MGANADSYYEYLLKMWLLKQQKVMPSALLLPKRQARLSCNRHVGSQREQSDLVVSATPGFNVAMVSMLLWFVDISALSGALMPWHM